MLRFPFLLVVAMLAVFATVTMSAQAPQYRARLSMVPIDVAMQATVAGSGSATASLKGSTLSITGTFSGLKTAATVARLHRSVKTGMRGAPIADLTISTATSGTISAAAASGRQCQSCHTTTKPMMPSATIVVDTAMP